MADDLGFIGAGVGSQPKEESTWSPSIGTEPRENDCGLDETVGSNLSILGSTIRHVCGVCVAVDRETLETTSQFS